MEFKTPGERGYLHLDVRRLRQPAQPIRVF
jgi:hypothetical protein